MKLLGILCPLLYLSMCSGYRILGVFPFMARSHFMMFEHLMKGLARKGHQVDVISTFPQKKPYANYTDLVVLPMAREFVNNFTYAEMNSLVGSLVVRTVAGLGGNDLCVHLGHPEIQNLVKNPPRDPPYDAVIIEVFGANCFAVIAHLLKVPLIGASSSALYPWSNQLIANPENLAILPNNLLSLPSEMSFWDRVYNVAHTVFNTAYFNYATAQQDEIIRAHFGRDLPGIRELEKEMSMILVNSHISMNGIRPMTPALIEVGGLHVQEEGLELPIALEKWMNESDDGFVYFTFGSMIKIESFPREVLDVFYRSLGKIAPVRVLMKIPDPRELPPGLPKNIHTEPWMPQVKVLKHRNVKAFITHGGLMGTQEAIYYGVPLLGIPLFADQFINIANYVQKNFAVKLDVGEITEEKMDHALNEILKNPIYRDTVRNISTRFLDRPMNAVDTANYWVEYIIKYGKNALKSPAMNLSWWQVELLDVYAFFLCTALAAICILLAVRKFLMDFVIHNANHSAPRAKKVN